MTLTPPWTSSPDTPKKDAGRHDNDGSEPTMTHVLASGTNYTAITIGLGIPLAICVAVAVIVWSYFRLQRHRADAVAMAHYRKLAEEAVANQQEMRTQLAQLTEHVRAVEKLMREVG
jgi:type VI protein secretion system component VasK